MSEEQAASELPLPGGSFRLMVQRMAYQGLIGLGVLENPVTGTTEVRLTTARTVIDDLHMLTEKTAGNLDEDEREQLEGIVRDLESAHAKASETNTDGPVT